MSTFFRMMDPFKNLKISTRLVTLFLLTTMVPLTVAGVLTFNSYVATIKQEVMRGLVSQNDLRGHEIGQYVIEKEDDIEILARDPSIIDAMGRYSDAFSSGGVDSEAYQDVDAEFSSFFKDFNDTMGYYDVFLISPAGDIVFSVMLETDFGTNLNTGPFRDSVLAITVRAAQNGRGTEMSDFTYYRPSDATTAFFAVPVLSDGRYVGTLAAQMSTDELFRFSQDYTSLGQSGEIALAVIRNNEAIFISPLRHDPDAAFKRTVPIGSGHAIPTQKAVQGEIGSGEFIDYRGVEVIAAWGPIPNVKWGIVVKIDTEEAYVPIRTVTRMFIWLGSIVLLAVIVVAVLVARSISMPIKNISGVTDLMAEGDLSARVDVNSTDEIGSLGNNFNQMIVSLADARTESDRLLWIANGQSELNACMRGEHALDVLGRNIIAFLSQYLGASIGALYVNDGNGLFNLTASYAYKTRKNLSNQFKAGDSLVGQAVYEKQPIVLTHVPEDYIAISSGLGEQPPSVIMVIPLVHNDVVIGVLEFGTFSSFTGRQKTFLDDAATAIAITLNSAQSRLQLDEALQQSRQLTEQLQVQQEELRVSNEELGEQTRNLQASEEQLKEQQEELRAANEELEEKTINLEERQRELSQNNEELDKVRLQMEKKAEDLEIAGKYKSEFLANMSHELRTPLNSMLILAQDLAANRTDNLDTDQVESASIIYQSGNDLLTLINDILDLSKIEAGKMTLSSEEIPLSESAEWVTANFKHVVRDKGLTLNMETDPDLPESIQTDGQRLAQILKNLLSNAIKFTEEGSITVRYGLADAQVDLSRSGLDHEQCVAVSVTDTGIGIPEEKLVTIYEAFQQADGSTSRMYGGTGLGLSISRELAKLLGGEIKVVSTVGEGSTFTLYLPLVLDRRQEGAGIVERRKEKAATPVAPGKADETDGTGGVDVIDRTDQDLPPAPSIDDDREKIHEDDKTILIIEDDVNFATILGKFCHERQFKFIHSGDGETGLKLAGQYVPDAIILDIRLPGIQGLSVLDVLKQQIDTRHIPVHMMSVEDKTADALQRGAIGFLNKPVDQGALDQAFTRITEMTTDHIRRLLIVEDDPAQQKSIVKLIGNSNVDPIAVASGGEALELLKSESFDCMILDLRLPDMTGFELLKRLSDFRDISVPPTIIYTGKEISQQEEEELETYASSVIIKGVRSPERLLDETALFLHQVVSNLPKDKQKMVTDLHDPDTMFRDKKVLLV
ncbi:MAG: response regulator, partial [Desulfobacterales bacterium]